MFSCVYVLRTVDLISSAREVRLCLCVRVCVVGADRRPMGRPSGPSMDWVGYGLDDIFCIFLGLVGLYPNVKFQFFPLKCQLNSAEFLPLYNPANRKIRLIFMIFG